VPKNKRQKVFICSLKNCTIAEPKQAGQKKSTVETADANDCLLYE
jgi:hypothetical protein